MKDDYDVDLIIPIVFRLQEILLTLNESFNLNIPKLVVLGNQGVGKSSVLENYLGSDFLPKGNGIITRRPIIIELVGSHSEYVKFPRYRNRFTDFSQIRRKINADTDRIAGTNNGVSKTPINLKLYSSNVLDMTMVDLPGMAKVPVGDQSYRIESKIRKIIMRYIKEENSILLVVSDAISDITNSAALKISREIDPRGIRTINVITKLDMIDKDTGAMELLTNCLLETCPGYIGIVNRNQRELDDKKDLNLALDSERDFFATCDQFKHMADRMGCGYLRQVINRKILTHIIRRLPTLKGDIVNYCATIDRDCTDVMTQVNALETELLKIVDVRGLCSVNEVDQDPNIVSSSLQDKSTVRREKAKRRRQRDADRNALDVCYFNKRHANMSYEMLQPYADCWSKRNGFFRSIRCIVKKGRSETSEKRVQIWKLTKAELPPMVSAIIGGDSVALIYVRDGQFKLPLLEMDQAGDEQLVVHVAGGRVEVVVVHGVQERQALEVVGGHSVRFCGGSGAQEAVWVRAVASHTTVMVESVRHA